MTTRYTTIGSVRNGCGHAHMTLNAARRCVTRDQRDCRAVRGYSDRHVYAYDAEQYRGAPSATRAISDGLRSVCGREPRISNAADVACMTGEEVPA